MAITASMRNQLREYQRRAIRVLAIVSVGLAFLAIGFAYLAFSLAKFLEASFGLFALGLTGLVFILLGVIVMLMARPRS